MKKGILLLALLAVASAASAREFIVGIADVCRTNDLCEVGPNYPSAVYAAGAMPYVLPCTTNAEAIAALLAFGGTLWQDLPSQKNGAAIHRLNGGEHGIATVKGSYLAGLAGETCPVNSRHHQAVKDVAKGFRVTATSPDGVVEAFEHETLPIMAFQFHPERMTEDPRFVALMRAALSDLKENSK